MMFVLDILMMTSTTPFAGYFLPFRLCAIHSTGLISVSIVMLVNMRNFDPPSSCALLKWVILVWVLVPLCLISSEQQY